MQKTAFFGTILICLFTSCGDRAVPVNPDASAEARELLAYLYALSGKQTLSGQHNYPGTLSEYTEEVAALTGHTPAIWGQDFGFTASGKDAIIHRERVIDEAVRKHREGYIVTLMWHAVRPTDDEPNGWKESVQNELTDEEWEALVTPGTDLHQRWLAQLDVVAGYLKQLRDQKVPVLWRPYHEMNGSWFWWGDKRGENGYIALWQNMYDYFTEHHQLNNLIWVWNANAPRDWENDEAYPYEWYYPGNAYVDVLAADIYKGDFKQSHHDQLVELGRGKPVAIGECGQLPTPEILAAQPQWTWFMCWAGYFTRANDLEAAKALYDAKRVLDKEEVTF